MNRENGERRGGRSVAVACAAVLIGVAQLGWLAMLYFGARWLIPN